MNGHSSLAVRLGWPISLDTCGGIAVSNQPENAARSSHNRRWDAPVQRNQVRCLETRTTSIWKTALRGVNVHRRQAKWGMSNDILISDSIQLAATDIAVN